MKPTDKVTSPGEELAVIEEFEGRTGVYRDGGTVRAMKVGRAKYNMKDRTVALELEKNTHVPKVGDTILAVVETAQPSVANSRIISIGERSSGAGFSAMMLNRSGGPRGRGKPPMQCNAGDRIRATVTSTLNGIFHISLAKPEDGVMESSCNICGGEVIRASLGVRCTTCGSYQDKKLAPDFR